MPRPRPHCVRWGSSSPKNGCSTPSLWPMSIVGKRLDRSRCHLGLGTKVGLGPGHIVLDGDPCSSPRKGHSSPRSFRPISIVAKRLPIAATTLKHLYKRSPGMLLGVWGHAKDYRTGPPGIPVLKVKNSPASPQNSRKFPLSKHYIFCCIFKYIGLVLTLLFDTSYNLNQLPSDWKIGYVTAIFKKDDKCDPSNYRPKSLTSIICKIMESIIRDHIRKFFGQHLFQ